MVNLIEYPDNTEHLGKYVLYWFESMIFRRSFFLDAEDMAMPRNLLTACDLYNLWQTC